MQVRDALAKNREAMRLALDWMLGMTPNLVDALPDDDRTRLLDAIDALRAALGDDA
jgi:hypothetical protein